MLILMPWFSVYLGLCDGRIYNKCREEIVEPTYTGDCFLPQNHLHVRSSRDLISPSISVGFILMWPTFSIRRDIRMNRRTPRLAAVMQSRLFSVFLPQSAMISSTRRPDWGASRPTPVISPVGKSDTGGTISPHAPDVMRRMRYTSLHSSSTALAASAGSGSISALDLYAGTTHCNIY